MTEFLNKYWFFDTVFIVYLLFFWATSRKIGWAITSRFILNIGFFFFSSIQKYSKETFAYVTESVCIFFSLWSSISFVWQLWWWAHVQNFRNTALFFQSPWESVQSVLIWWEKNQILREIKRIQNVYIFLFKMFHRLYFKSSTFGA